MMRRLAFCTSHELMGFPRRFSPHHLRQHGAFEQGSAVILEIAEIRIAPGQQAAFDEAIQRGLRTVISQAKGARGWKVNKGVESPERYVLTILWETLEDHTVHFREGPLFPQWRAIVGPFFASPPLVEHFTLVGQGGEG
jgi:heme-degrading monooxygenase HmoA